MEGERRTERGWGRNLRDEEREGKYSKVGAQEGDWPELYGAAKLEGKCVLMVYEVLWEERKNKRRGWRKGRNELKEQYKQGEEPERVK